MAADKDTLTRADLADIVHKEIGMSKQESIEIIEKLLDEIAIALSRGDTVKLSSFGSFVPRDKKERIGRNPKTGVAVPITPRRVVSFKSSQVLKDRVNKK